ncbi:MAG: beta-galactosidase [Anaerolineae bacterium]|nr:beta-galactosidase [Anaerolineae bacterium]
MNSQLVTSEPMELWAFLENSDFQRRKGGTLYRQDEVALIRHDEFLDEDHRLMKSIGCVGIRDAARWYISQPRSTHFDWYWLDRVVESAQKHGLNLYLDLWHYGYPDWMDILSDEAPEQFASFAREIALRYPHLTHYCICNEPSLMVDYAGKRGRWRPFLRGANNADRLRRQICRMIIRASEAVLQVNPKAQLILPDPWHATDQASEDKQAAVIDTVLGRRDSELGGRSALITAIGLNHYRDSTLPPFHILIQNAFRRWSDKPIWFTETSGPPIGWQQCEWFWWMLAEVRLAAYQGAPMPVFTWAPAISMYDWVQEERQLHNGIWRIGDQGERLADERMIASINLARQYGYIH